MLLITRNTLSRLDWSFYALRWILVLGIFGLALTVSAIDPTKSDWLRAQLMVATGIGALLAVGNLGLLLWPSRGIGPTIAGLLLDSSFALLLLWATEGIVLIFVAAAILPVVAAAMRIGKLSSPLLAFTLAVVAAVIYGLAYPEGDQFGYVVLGGFVLLLLSVFISLPINIANLGWVGQQVILHERETDAGRLRAAREHARAIYEMAATLSATLNYQAVLDAALDVGVLGLRKVGPARLVSAVLLYDKNSGQLKVANSRRLTHADTTKQVPGRRGVLGLALKQAEPVFANDARRDPELKYFVAFQDSRSILCVPLRAGFDNFGVLVFGSTIPNAFSEEHVELLTAIASQATIALQNATLYQNLLEEKERIIEVEEDARKQLSRDLHDGPTQSIAAIAMRVNYIRRLLEREPEQVPPELQKVEELARKTTKEIRHMLFTLRPLILETQGLVPALGELAKKMKETHGQNVIIQVQEHIENYIDPNDQNVLFNIVDECVNNARKHAEAEHIWVRLGRRDNYLLLEVQDDGVGFDTDEVDANYDQRGSLGMINLRERAELLDGSLRIESAEGKGTKVSLIVGLNTAPLQLPNQETRSAEAAASEQRARRANPRPPR